MNRVEETTERIKNYINDHIFEIVTVQQLKNEIKIPIGTIRFCFKQWYNVYPKEYIEWGKITLFAALCRAGGKADKSIIKEYAARLGYFHASSLYMLIERKLKMKICDFCKAVLDDIFYNKLLDNPFVRINSVTFVKAIVKKYHIDKAK
jgi:AraC-like DNA-binding protein